MQLFNRRNTAEEDIYKRLSLDPEKDTLLDEIALARRQLDDAYNNFQNASDPDLIDCYIYEGNAAWKRYRFLLKQARML
ncbi:YaaL family protein [Faecalicatena contorta]|uniref:YaaL family protein n=1 Tax=Faecalicatena contorta TaxID=39482 RepID=UPI001F1ECC53|nr:YaaL family protein [Faecalicatena contorta]MCF2683741.1 YaaL family protein [Faecalicatena contorta]